MKREFRIIIPLLAVLAGCSVTDGPVPDVIAGSPGGGEVTVVLGGGEVTKTTGTVTEGKVAEWTLLLVNELGELEDCGRVEGSGSQTLHVRTGRYTAYAWVNFDKPLTYWNSGNASGESIRLGLTNEVVGAFRMGGSEVIEVTREPSSVTIPVRRRVCAVQVKKVMCDFSGTPSLSGVTSMKLRSMYLINVAGNCTLNADVEWFPTNWYNKRGHVSPEVDALCYDAVDRSILTSPYTTSHTFYCYPNPTPSDSHSTSSGFLARYTRLVLECEMDGTVYYYAVDFPLVKANCKYILGEVRIVNRGSLDPDDPARIDARVTVTEDWDGEIGVNEQRDGRN